MCANDAGYTVAIGNGYAVMPEQDGLMLAEALRHTKEAKSLPLIMLTSSGNINYDPRIDYFAACLTKPVKASYLQDRFIEVLSPADFEHRVGHRENINDELDAEMAKHHPLRILLAEDNAINQKVALSVLESLGYQARVASNGVETLNIVQSDTFDVILMDVQMPGMDGYATTRALREEGFDGPIVALTAHAMRSEIRRCFEAGCNSVLTKPISRSELIQQIAASLMN